MLHSRVMDLLDRRVAVTALTAAVGLLAGWSAGGNWTTGVVTGAAVGTGAGVAVYRGRRRSRPR